MRRSWTTLVLVALVTVAVSVPTAVWASHRFTDVPDSNVFHGDIAWLAENGVTLGCNPPGNTEFCPDESVSREQMAAFMHRLADSRSVDAGSLLGHNVRQLGAIFGTRDKNMEWSGPTSGAQADVATKLNFEAPTDGVILVTGEVGLRNVDERSTQGHAVLTLDWDGAVDTLDSVVVDGNTHGLSPLETSDATASVSLSTAVPVSQGEHVVHLLLQSGVDQVLWNLENISVVFSPTGSATGPGVTPVSDSGAGDLLP